jgi:hypothetical protein
MFSKRRRRRSLSWYEIRMHDPSLALGFRFRLAIAQYLLIYHMSIPQLIGFQSSQF